MDDLNNDLLKYQEVKKYLSDVIKLEDAMSNITNLTSTALDINKLKPFKVSQLASEVPFLNWTAFFQSAFTSVTLEDPTIVFDDLEVLIQVSTTHYEYTMLQNTHMYPNTAIPYVGLKDACWCRITKGLEGDDEGFFSLESALICFEGLGFAYTFLEILRLFQFTV